MTKYFYQQWQQYNSSAWNQWNMCRCSYLHYPYKLLHYDMVHWHSRLYLEKRKKILINRFVLFWIRYILQAFLPTEQFFPVYPATQLQE